MVFFPLLLLLLLLLSHSNGSPISYLVYEFKLLQTKKQRERGLVTFFLSIYLHGLMMVWRSIRIVKNCKRHHDDEDDGQQARKRC